MLTDKEACCCFSLNGDELQHAFTAIGPPHFRVTHAGILRNNEK